MDKRFLMTIGAIIVIFGGIVALNGGKDSGKAGTASNHVEGQGKSNVTLVEYGDYECPYCEQYYSTVKQVVATYDADIHFQFRNLPLTQIHRNAFAAARAAEAAGLQNKFWEMHDALYQNQSAWVDASNPQKVFISMASQLGLNKTQFEKDYVGQKVNGIINADINAFNKTGETVETPAFFLNGKKVSPGNSIDSFKKILDPAIAAAAKNKAPVN